MQGGLYAVTDRDRRVPCTESAADVEGSAFYCPSGDVVAWGADDLIPHMVETYGPLGLGLVIAHEVGSRRAVPGRGGGRPRCWCSRQRADCYAGAWVADVRRGGDRRYFVVNGRTLDLALAGFLELRHPGRRADASAHGTAFDRIRAFQEASTGGPSTCGCTADDLAPPGRPPFTDQADLDSGGNLDLQGAFDLTVADLEDFWTEAWSSVGGDGRFDAPGEGVLDGPSKVLRSPGRSVKEVFYCADTNVLAVQEDGLVTELHARIGDYALGEVVGSGYSLAAMQQLGIPDRDAAPGPAPPTAPARCGRHRCSPRNRESAQLQLSPGDLDEAVSTRFEHRRAP